MENEKGAPYVYAPVRVIFGGKDPHALDEGLKEILECLQRQEEKLDRLIKTVEHELGYDEKNEQ